MELESGVCRPLWAAEPRPTFSQLLQALSADFSSLFSTLFLTRLTTAAASKKGETLRSAFGRGLWSSAARVQRQTSRHQRPLVRFLKLDDELVLELFLELQFPLHRLHSRTRDRGLITARWSSTAVPWSEDEVEGIKNLRPWTLHERPLMACGRRRFEKLSTVSRVQCLLIPSSDSLLSTNHHPLTFSWS
jgi:hypothetical protein